VKILGLLLTLFASLAFAQAGPGPQSGGITRASFLRTYNYSTPGTGAQSYFVDPTGDDNNSCTEAGTAACLTIQGAINRIPKLLRDKVSVSVAAGSYAGFTLSGFTNDYGVQATNAGLLIDGALANSTGLASGSATGTASGGTAGSTSTFGTLTTAAAGWTVNDLRGRFITITGGTGVGQVKVIASNTATNITIAGTWTAPTGTSTYAVQDSSVAITGCITAPPSGSGTVAAANSAIRVQGNATGSTVTLRALSISAACSFGVVQADSSSVVLNRLQFTSTAGTASRMTMGGGFMIDTVASTYSGATGTHINGAPLAAVNASVAGNVGNIAGPAVASGTIQNSLFQLGLGAINLSAYIRSTVLGLEIVNMAGSAVLLGSSITNLQGLHVDCTGAASAIGLSIAGNSNYIGGISPDHVDITDCFTGVNLVGPVFVQSANAMTVTGVTTGLVVKNGAQYTFTASGVLSPVVGNEIELDSAAVTSTFADIVGSGSCLNSTNYNSRVCRD
jgi:hypothetical protein